MVYFGVLCYPSSERQPWESQYSSREDVRKPYESNRFCKWKPKKTSGPKREGKAFLEIKGALDNTNAEPDTDADMDVRIDWLASESKTTETNNLMEHNNVSTGGLTSKAKLIRKLLDHLTST